MRRVTKGATPQHYTPRADARQRDFSPEDYKLFAGFLIQRLGEYCSYCETPLGADLAVEHKRPKSIYIDLETEWSNFLLACRNCNSRKGATDAGSNACWPDTDDTFAMLTYAPAANGDVVVAASAAGGARATALINLVSLNAVTADDMIVADRRLANRTAAWGMAQGQAARLVNMMNVLHAALAPDAILADPGFALLCQRILGAAVACGFWSVWMTVFGNALAGVAYLSDAQRQTIRENLFGPDVFPGTVFPQ